MNSLIDQFFNLTVMQEALPYLLKGLLITIGLTVVLAPLGMIAGLALALGSNPRNPFLRIVVRSWINVFRAMPPLVLIILAFSALPFIGIHLPAFACVVVALLLNNSSYYCEIFRAGLGSVGPGQLEAARSTGLGTWDAMRFVVLPQATRNVLPDLASNTIEVMKATSLAAIVAVNEMLYVAGTIRSVTYNTSPLTLAAIIYLAILLPAVRLTGRLERKPLL
ncbi:polar amino acid ABC transporter permease (plasmid) [Pararhizobium polonicum]|uniref:Polar amino acid ABC transporter permease n=1 Tax=Pararhizobium polonicum TaxID=1612624 RepID=A0A1C7P8Q2_9HYPH|nr:amino acid ABC transporter permease [Pararhizobium polonicum]OBZ97571.1 polar amino acid ABC transporter permease [Pararhizobium polonicum]